MNNFNLMMHFRILKCVLQHAYPNLSRRGWGGGGGLGGTESSTMEIHVTMRISLLQALNGNDGATDDHL